MLEFIVWVSILIAQVVIGLVILAIPTIGFYELGRRLSPHEDELNQWGIGLAAVLSTCIVLYLARAIGMAVIG